MRKFKVLMVLLAVIVFSGVVFAVDDSCEQSYSKLMEGNQRCVSGVLAQKDLSDAKRQELAKGQKPFAIIVTCSDSRVAPEYIFDQGLGDIFVVRVAGNVVDPIALGSIEYAAEHLHAPLVMVLGHSKCGAVAATLEAKGKPEGNIGAILNKIMPAAKAAEKKGGTKEDILECAIKENVKNTANDIMKKSKVVQHLVHEGKLKVVAGEYNLATGKVEIIELAQAGKQHHEMHGH